MPEHSFDFERLDAFKVALEALETIDAIAFAMPAGRGYVRDQLVRAANSVVLNFAEGAGEFAPAEKARFYRMAKRSATECAAQLLVYRRLCLADEDAVTRALSLLRRGIDMLTAMIREIGRREERSRRSPTQPERPASSGAGAGADAGAGRAR